MKKIFLAGLFVGVSLLITGCTTPKTAGQDSVYLNQNRGAEGAQISEEEAAQYKRQQDVTADEIRLENMKRRQSTDAVKESSEAASSVAGATKDGVGAIKSIKNLFQGW